MTTADPYPTNLDELDVFDTPALPEQDPNVRVLSRIAVALEQIALALLDRPTPVQNAPGAALTALPPVQTTQPQTNGVCPIHNAPWKTVPAGISKKTGAAYTEFKACSVSGCDQRPPR